MTTKFEANIEQLKDVEVTLSTTKRLSDWIQIKDKIQAGYPEYYSRLYDFLREIESGITKYTKALEINENGN